MSWRDDPSVTPTKPAPPPKNISWRDDPVVNVKPPRTGMDKATQVAGVTTNALLPYATAALAGGAAGAPFGGVGAIPGAAGGVLSLGVADLGTALYNLGGSLFNAERIPLPSETISKGYRSVGIGRAPETPGEQVYSDVLEGGVGAFSQGKAAQNLFKTGSKPVQNFMADMGKNIRGQTVAGAAAAGAPSVASNYFDVTNPYALAGLSLTSGMAGNKVARSNPKPVTAAELKRESSTLYKQMEGEGVQIAPQAMADLNASVRTKLSDLRYDADTDKLVNQALDLFSKKSGKPMSFEMLEEFRKSIRDLPYTQSGAGRGTPKERAIIAALDDTIDKYMDNLTPAQVSSGDPAAAAAFLKKARDVRARGYRTETLENAFTKATATSDALNSNKSYPQALRDEFGKIAKDPRKLSKFDKPTQELIKKVANGTATQSVFAALGKLSPSATMLGMKNIGYGAGGFAAPTTTATIAGLTSGSKAIANRMTKGQANRALISAAQPGGNIKPGGPGYFALSPIAQQNVMAQDRANKRKR